MKQCFSWWAFANRGVDNATLMRRAKEIGYGGVELIGRELWDEVLDNGLEIVANSAHNGFQEGLNNPANHDGFERDVEASLELAQKYKMPKLIVFSGNRRPGLTDEEGLEHTVTGLKRVAPMAEQAGVMLILELLNSKVDHGGYQCDNSLWASRVIEAVGSPQVKVLYDIYHAQIMEGDLIRNIRDRGVHFGHYHTAGNPGRHDLDDEQEIHYPAVFRAIAATGYDGYIGHEFIPKGDPISGLQAAYNVLATSLPV